ncbi:MAG TPA: 30S ribosomal protein S12 methylthiotransferase RimO, partial [Firmicutes bacterium]|nr:30S ribosomal protein S12 methylthiotransferase RimO [Bacillota bacterium]
MIKVCLVNLGCSKNRVDSEAVLGLFQDKNRFEIVVDENDADVIIINTCAFIHDAEDESFDTIRYLETLNKKLIVLGCLVEKYHDELKKKFPKVDLFVGFKEFSHLSKDISNLLKIDDLNDYNIFDRIKEDNAFSIYLKIAEGCNHKCGFYIIPNLRGTYYSLPLDELVSYAEKAIKSGVKEI